MRCPRCHRPLEDDAEGPYVCCAGAVLQWQCRQCSKRSTGFAFPYGRCPHCAGELVALDGTAEATARAPMTALRTAFEIELGGRAYYQRAAADCDDDTLRALFARFALMEGEHMETLARRYHVDIPDPSPAFRLETASLFAGVVPAPNDAEQLFKVAIALEQRATALFTGLAAQHADAVAEQRLYRELAAEEADHAALLETEFARWRERRAGLLGSAPAAAAVPGSINAAALLLSHADDAHIALVCGDQRLSYRELRDRVARAAASRSASTHTSRRPNGPTSSTRRASTSSLPNRWPTRRRRGARA
jgi:rubrerythrin